MKYYFFLVFYFLVNTIIAQLPNNKNIKLELEGTTEEIFSYKQMNGSPYRYKEFEDGKVYLKSNTEAIAYKINYNAYKDHFEYIEGNVTYAVANPKKINNIVIDGETFIYTKYYNYDNLKEGYFIEIEDDYISLYKRELISMISPKNIDYSSTPYINGDFVRLKPMYYISIYGDPLILLKSKSKLLELFFNHPDLKQFIKKEKIKLHDEDDLKKLITFLNNFDKNKK